MRSARQSDVDGFADYIFLIKKNAFSEDNPSKWRVKDCCEEYKHTA